VQTCFIHLIRDTFRLASKRNWDTMRRDVKPIYTAINADAARVAFDDLVERWGQRYPAIVRLWDNAWNEFIPFLHYDLEIRRVIFTTDPAPDPTSPKPVGIQQMAIQHNDIRQRLGINRTPAPPNSRRSPPDQAHPHQHFPTSRLGNR
jgi:hypothetical protein